MTSAAGGRIALTQSPLGARARGWSASATKPAEGTFYLHRIWRLLCLWRHGASRPPDVRPLPG